MKEFNLELALKGNPVVTREGVEVNQFVLFNAENEPFPLFGVSEDMVDNWSKEGVYIIDDTKNKKDLFMVPVKKKTMKYKWRKNKGTRPNAKSILIELNQAEPLPNELRIDRGKGDWSWKLNSTNAIIHYMIIEE